MSHTVPNSKDWSPEELMQIESNTIDLNVFADRMFEQLEAMPPLLEKVQVYEIEDRVQKDVMRRAAFAFASLSGADLCKKIEEDRAFAVSAAAIFSELEDLQKKYKAMADIFGDLQGRLMIALCSCEDMDVVLKEGRAAIVSI